MKNKILFISHWYPSISNINLGIFIKKHAIAISKFEQIDVVHFDIQHSKKFLLIKLEKEPTVDFITYKIIIHSPLYKLFYYFLPLQMFLFHRLTKKFKMNMSDYKIIHSNVVFPNGIIGYFLSKKYNIPQIHTEHWTKIIYFLNRDFFRYYGKKALLNAKTILPVSGFLKNLINQKVKCQDYDIVPNVIDSSIFKYNPKIKNNDTIRFLCIAYWRKPKNPFYFLNALEELYKKGKITNFELSIIGDGPQIKVIKSNNYPFRINYLGKIDPDKIQDYYTNSDFFLHGSDFETFSVVIVEALLTGTPVIVNDVGIANEVINETNGYICYNEMDWINNIELAIKNDYNHYQISESLKGKFDELSIGEKIKDIYNRVLNS